MVRRYGFFVDARTKIIARKKAKKFLKGRGEEIVSIKPSKYTAKWLVKYRKKR